MGVFEELEHDLGHLLHRHHTSAAPAAATINTSTPGGNPMSLTQLDDTVKADLTKGLDWMEGFVGRVKAAAPGIIATAEKYENSPIVQALEGAFLTPEQEQQIAGFINMLAKANPVPAAAQATPQQPEQAAPSFTPTGPVVAGQA